MKLKRTDWRILATIALTFTSATALAHEYAKDNIFVDHPWARPGRAASVPAAVYFDMVNRGGEGDRLIAAGSERAEHVEIHVSEKAGNGRVAMRLLKDGIALPAHSTVSLEGGSYHIMLIGLGTALEEGESFPMTLTFEKAGEVEVVVKVEDRAAPAPGGHSHH